jgi:hypothetical protein
MRKPNEWLGVAKTKGKFKDECVHPSNNEWTYSILSLNETINLLFVENFYGKIKHIINTHDFTFLTYDYYYNNVEDCLTLEK